MSSSSLDLDFGILAGHKDATAVAVNQLLAAASGVSAAGTNTGEVAETTTGGVKVKVSSGGFGRFVGLEF